MRPALCRVWGLPSGFAPKESKSSLETAALVKEAEGKATRKRHLDLAFYFSPQDRNLPSKIKIETLLWSLF